MGQSPDPEAPNVFTILIGCLQGIQGLFWLGCLGLWVVLGLWLVFAIMCGPSH